MTVIVAVAFLAGLLSTGVGGGLGRGLGDATTAVPRALGLNELARAIAGLVSPGDEPGNQTAARARVVRAVDGDTVEVALRGGQIATVRLIGIDTPETKRPGVAVACGGPEASAAMTKLAEGQPVRLIGDASQDTVDRYGRHLRYAEVNGRDVGQQLVAAGWAAPYVYDSSSPPARIDRYRTAAKTARASGRGVWTRCGGNFQSSSPEPWSGD